jgi:hypothetical protein
LPITKLPKACITFPANPDVKISLVEEIFRDNLIKVVISNIEGNIEKSIASLTYIVVSNIIIDSEIFKISKKSNKIDGTGMIIINTIPTTNIAAIKSENFKISLLLTS